MTIHFELFQQVNRSLHIFTTARADLALLGYTQTLLCASMPLVRASLCSGQFGSSVKTISYCFLGIEKGSAQGQMAYSMLTFRPCLRQRPITCQLGLPQAFQV